MFDASPVSRWIGSFHTSSSPPRCVSFDSSILLELNIYPDCQLQAENELVGLCSLVIWAKDLYTGTLCTHTKIGRRFLWRRERQCRNDPAHTKVGCSRSCRTGAHNVTEFMPADYSTTNLLSVPTDFPKLTDHTTYENWVRAVRVSVKTAELVCGITWKWPSAIDLLRIRKT